MPTRLCSDHARSLFTACLWLPSFLSQPVPMIPLAETRRQTHGDQPHADSPPPHLVQPPAAEESPGQHTDRFPRTLKDRYEEAWLGLLRSQIWMQMAKQRSFQHAAGVVAVWKSDGSLAWRYATVIRTNLVESRKSLLDLLAIKTHIEIAVAARDRILSAGYRWTQVLRDFPAIRQDELRSLAGGDVDGTVLI